MELKASVAFSASINMVNKGAAAAAKTSSNESGNSKKSQGTSSGDTVKISNMSQMLNAQKSLPSKSNEHAHASKKSESKDTKSSEGSDSKSNTGSLESSSKGLKKSTSSQDEKKPVSIDNKDDKKASSSNQTASSGNSANSNGVDNRALRGDNGLKKGQEQSQQRDMGGIQSERKSNQASPALQQGNTSQSSQEKVSLNFRQPQGNNQSNGQAQTAPANHGCCGGNSPTPPTSNASAAKANSGNEISQERSKGAQGEKASNGKSEVKGNNSKSQSAGNSSHAQGNSSNKATGATPMPPTSANHGKSRASLQNPASKNVGYEAYID